MLYFDVDYDDSTINFRYICLSSSNTMFTYNQVPGHLNVLQSSWMEAEEW